MPAQSEFAKALGTDGFLVTCEVDPPKGIVPSLGEKTIAVFKDKVQALVVSDNPKARMQMAPLGYCRYLLDQGLEPIMTLTCRDRNRLALQSDLLAASALGIQNILAVTGDYISWGDHPETRPVYDLDSVQLLWTIGQINSNRDLSGNTLSGPSPSFTAGAAVNLTSPLVLPQVLKFRKKEQAGAQFFMSHPIFDLAGVEGFFNQIADLKIPVLASVCLLKEEQVRDYLPGKFPGWSIPEKVVEAFQGLDPKEFNPRMVEYTAKWIKEIRKDGRFRGIHLLLQGAEDRIGELV